MARKSLLRMGAFAGLLFVGSLALWNEATRVGTQSAGSDFRAALSSPAAVSLQPERRAKSAAILENAALLSARDEFREGWANVIAELEGDTNHMRFEFRAVRLQEFVNSISTNDIGVVFAQLLERQNQHPTEVGRDMQMRLLQRWLETDIHAAAQAASGVRAEDRQEVYEHVAAMWARQDLAESVSWAQKLSDPNERQNALLSIAYEVASKDPREAIWLASQTTVPPEKMDLVTQAASAWAAEAPETAAEWARQIQDGPFRDQVLVAVATSWADKNPQAAAELVIDSLSPGPDQENAVIGVMQRLAFKGAEAATAWVQQFPEGSLRDNAMAELNRISERRRLVQTGQKAVRSGSVRFTAQGHRLP